MAGFKLKINVEPNDIPRLDDAHKRDCADALTNAVNSTLKYTLIMSGAVMAFYASYSFFGFTWMMRMHSMLPNISVFVPIAAVVIFLFEFISGMMQKWALSLQILFHGVMIFAAATSRVSLIIIPFALYGAVLHFKLITLLPWHKVISAQPGYPEFTPLPEKKQSPSEKTEEASEPSEVTEKPETEEKPEPAEAPESEEKPEPEKKPEPAENKKPAGSSNGGSKKKRRRKKRKK